MSPFLNVPRRTGKSTRSGHCPLETCHTAQCNHNASSSDALSCNRDSHGHVSVSKLQLLNTPRTVSSGTFDSEVTSDDLNRYFGAA